MKPGVPAFPPEFERTIQATFGVAGENWLVSLPDILQDTCLRWGLTLGDPFQLSYNYVAAVTLQNGAQAVLKAGVPNSELTSEINTLRLVNGQAACHLLREDASKGLLLLERLQPGIMLADLSDDDQATRIASRLMRQFWMPPPSDAGYLDLRDWFDGLQGLRHYFSGGTGPFNRHVVERVESLLPSLLAETSNRVLMHADLHHYNILLSDRGWLAIDPKGVVGPAEYEVGPLMMNPFLIPISPQKALQRARRRIDILTEELGFDRQKIQAWALCHGLLSAWWDIQDGSTDLQYSLECLDVYSTLKF